MDTNQNQQTPTQDEAQGSEQAPQQAQVQLQQPQQPQQAQTQQAPNQSYQQPQAQSQPYQQQGQYYQQSQQQGQAYQPSQGQPYQQQEQPYQQQPYNDYTPGGYGVPPTGSQPGVYAPAPQMLYPMTEGDRTLRLIAFIFMIISVVSVGWMIIPLAWMIPMTVMCWKVYKGTRPNTTAFGVCSLIFVSLVSGILLLCSQKNQ